MWKLRTPKDAHILILDIRVTLWDQEKFVEMTGVGKLERWLSS